MLAQFVVESQSSKYDSDYKYIKAFLNQYYNIRTSVKLNPIHLHGKTNYNKKEKEINKMIKRYHKSQNTDQESVVFFCLDVDNPDLNDNEKLNKEIENYCKGKNYELIWFYRDVEEVFWGKRCKKEEKIDKANQFLIKNVILSYDISKLENNNVKKGISTSNLKIVVDKYFHTIAK